MANCFIFFLIRQHTFVKNGAEKDIFNCHSSIYSGEDKHKRDMINRKFYFSCALFWRLNTIAQEKQNKNAVNDCYI